MKIASFLILILLMITPDMFANNCTNNNKWEWLIGEWVAEVDGEKAPEQGGFTLKADLDGNILVRESYAKVPKTAQRESFVHKDKLIVYQDKAIYFDNEGHVIDYIIFHEEKSVIFQSQAKDNMPVFRLIYNCLDENHIDVVFQISMNGEDFITHVQSKCCKVSQ